MIQKIVVITITFAVCLFTGCERLPNGPVTPDGYRPPAPTQENIESMVREAIKNMVFIEGGSFEMGNFICYTGDIDQMVEKHQVEHIYCYANEAPLHKVTLDSFHLNKYEISYYEYDLFTQAVNRPLIQDDYLDPQWWKTRGETREAIIEKFTNFRTGDTPAAIDWFQASDYCRWLGAVTDLPIDLPTEAEWEYAARNRGQNIVYATDTGKLEIGRNYPRREDGKRHIVNSYLPNPLGLHHMLGNTAEWVNDWFDENYYQTSPQLNPQGPKVGLEKILRGGSGGNKPTHNHNFKRIPENIDYAHDHERQKMFGFNEGDARSSHGARCAIHLSEPIDIDNLKIDLTQPAPDSRAEWLATKDGRTTSTE